ncbi:MAG: calcium-binding protein, partial [Pseudomonadota bacterium]
IETVVTNGNWIVGAGGNQGTNVFDFSVTSFRETASGPQTGGRIDAGGSNDVVTGSGGSDTILGGDGHDTLTGGAGNDSIDGGSGVDTAFFDTTSFNTVGDFSKWSQSIALTNGTLGTDSFTNVETIALHDIRLEWQNGEWRFFDKAGAIVSGKTVTMTQAGTQSMGFGDDTVNGTGVGDTINLNAGDDRASAGGGDDTVWGRGGNDTIDGGWGRDKLYGGADNDDLRGGTEGDLLDGGAGNDRLDGGADTDTISGGAGNDTIVSRGGESVIDIMKGGDGEDTLVIDGNDLALHNFVNSDVDLNIGSKDAWGRTLFGVSGVEIVVTNGKMIVGAGANQG